jgi:hypothetical protein
MRHKYLAQLLSSTYLVSTVVASFGQPEVHNANYIFNAIHSSARQWGSTINHNGMSLFLATVPAGTQFYHGTFKSDFVQGPEWLAFEPEHALVFARPRVIPPPGEGEISGEEHQVQLPINENIQQPVSRPTTTTYPIRESRTEGLIKFHQPSRSPHQLEREQQPLGPPTYQTQADVGYLHTYVSKHDLHLLYIDGLSAAKTPNGTLDTQDMLILNLTAGPRDPWAREWARARGMCSLASALWEDRINGIVRMEGGFEIIMCDFEKHLDRTEVIAISPRSPVLTGGFLGGWSYIKAVTTRYFGIGGDRIRLDYDEFVSVFAYPDIDGLFTNDVQSDYIMPRLQNVKNAHLLRARADLTEMILRKDRSHDVPSKNWQAVADMVVARYSGPLHYLHTDKQIRLDRKGFEQYLTNLLYPFLDSTARNTTLETRRCVAELISLQHNTSLAYRTIRGITYHICNTLLTALSTISLSTDTTPLDLIDNLVEYLQWTTWKNCGTCPDEQVCYIPIWPMGSHEDHARPQCRSETDARDRWGYWGWMPPRPPPEKGEDRV